MENVSEDGRPANCRFRLQDERRPYPKSSCAACGKTIMTGLGKSCTAALAEKTCPSCGGDGVNPEGLMRPDGSLADCQICHGRGTVSGPLSGNR